MSFDAPVVPADVKQGEGKQLAVGQGHELYFEVHGPQSAPTVLVLHGGPGSGTGADVIKLFDLERHRVVLFDQRGAGRSMPAGSCTNNTTQHLLNDIERVRAHLQLDRCYVYGGSWGATLAMLYVQRFPEYVNGVLLRGVFLARRSDVEWFFGPEGVAQELDEEYQRFCGGRSIETAAEILNELHQLLRGDESDRLFAAKRWLRWETLVTTGKAFDATPSARQMQTIDIAAHYAVNDYFIGPGGVPLNFEGADQVPCHVIHGARDRVCRPVCAQLVCDAWPGASLQIIDKGTHVSSDPAIAAAMRETFTELLQ